LYALISLSVRILLNDAMPYLPPFSVDKYPEGTVFGGFVCPNYATTTTPATTTVVGT
jgi:hypothetical protein